MIQVQNLSVAYSAQQALCDISLTIDSGEFVLVSGPSGCGKSTLALALTGLIPQVVPVRLSGCIAVNGKDTQTHPVPELAQQIGLVFQNPAVQLFHATVEEEVAFAPRNLHLPAEQVAARVAESLEMTGVGHLRRRTVRSLSGGEQQRVAIASVLALRPSVLVLDEPTANLDWQGVERLMETLAHLHREHGVTVVLIEHRFAAAASLATRVVLMDAGRVVVDSPPDTVLTNKALLASLGLRYPWHDLGRQIEISDSAAPPPGVEPLVALRGVTAGYGREPVLSNLDLALYPGQFAALVGGNGAGKTTVARLLGGILRPQRGRVAWHSSARRMPAGQRAGLLFQNPLHQLVCDSVEEEVALGPRALGLGTDFSPLLEAGDLTQLQDRRPQNLSAGQQQRVALAATLALRPRLLILDEPTMGQDWGHLSRLMDYLTCLHGNGQAILLITHDDRLVCRYAQRIVRLDGGRVVADGAAPRPVPVPSPLDVFPQIRM